jgi:hypothetical protein
LSRTPCPVETCDRPAKSGGMCGACISELHRALDAVAELAAELDLTLSRQTPRGATAGRSSVVPLPYDPRASEAAYVLRSTLAGWVRALRDQNPDGDDDPPDDTPPAMAAWLSQRLQRLVRHPAAPEAHGEITEAVRAARRVVDRPHEWQFAGYCDCGAALYARPGAATVRCRGCDADPYDVDERRQAMLAAVADQLMPAHQAAAALSGLVAPLSADLVRKWAERGQIDARGRDLAGRPLYRLSDVLDRLLRSLERRRKEAA